MMSLFQMVLLDVLIIGGGPHALTLASLLSSTEPDANWNPGGHDLAPCATCSTPQSTVERTGSECTRQKTTTKKQSPAAGKASYLEIKRFIT